MYWRIKNKKMIPLAKPYFDCTEIDEISKVLESGWVSNGPKVREFENKVSNLLNVNNAVALSNCTAALHLALLSLGVGKGDEVLVADYTFPATGHSVLYCGAKPVFIDVDPQTYNMNPNLIEERITDKTKAIIPVHLFGQLADMESICEIARKYNLFVIEDAACAFSSEFRLSGDIACFSFHARKNLVTGEGGMAITDSDPISDKIRKLSTFGTTSIDGRLIFDDLGYNYKMSDITASVGVTQLKSIDKVTSKKRYLANLWDERLKEISYIEQPYLNSNHVYQSYVTTVDECIDRNKLMNKLRGEDIGCQIGTYASHTQPVYNSSNNCPISYYLYNRSLALPLYYELTEREIDEVYMCLRSI